MKNLLKAEWIKLRNSDFTMTSIFILTASLVFTGFMAKRITPFAGGNEWTSLRHLTLLLVFSTIYPWLVSSVTVFLHKDELKNRVWLNRILSPQPFAAMLFAKVLFIGLFAAALYAVCVIESLAFGLISGFPGPAPWFSWMLGFILNLLSTFPLICTVLWLKFTSKEKTSLNIIVFICSLLSFGVSQSPLGLLFPWSFPVTALIAMEKSVAVLIGSIVWFTAVSQLFFSLLLKQIRPYQKGGIQNESSRI
ncbi:ABC transporter permease [Bacillus licheniformis]|uniref:ABC transporter permease n=1 Tax=Bacillus licheniformis TaxID=1402 RepID=UPI0033158F37